MNLTIRDATASDVPFLVATWRKAVMYSSPTFEHIPHEVVYEKYTPVIKSILAKASVRILCMTSEPNIVLGYAVLEDAKLHFVYIKKAWRNQGFANLLINTTPIKTITHLTKPGLALAKKRGWTFDPFQI